MAVVIMKQARGPYASVGIAPSYFSNEIYQAVSFLLFPTLRLCSRACHMPDPSHRSWFDCPNAIRRGLYVM